MNEPLPISLVAHTAFCERRAWLEAQGESVPSAAIEQGVADHARVDARDDERSTRRRSVAVWHSGLGLSGRCDVVESGEAGLEVVEFKSSPVRRSVEVTRAQRVQLALQRLCLEAMGHEVAGARVHFTTLNRSVGVPLGPHDLDEARSFVERTRRVVSADSAPPPLVDDPRCSGCSHQSVCLPDERRGMPVGLRIVVPDPHGEVLHVTTQGSRVSLRRGRLVISLAGEELSSVPLERVHAVAVHGNVDLSGAALRELLWRSRVVTWCSGRGKLVGLATSTHSPNGAARVTQHVRAWQGDQDLANELIGSKIANQATQLRRNGDGNGGGEVARLRALARDTQRCTSLHELLGVEGDAAAIYFRRLPTMIKAVGREIGADWPGRRSRGARDALNVSFNFVYGLLLADVVRAVVAAGLDPHAGFVHSSGRNKPALALDLMEQFRPVVADSVVLGAINNGELNTGMVSHVLGDARLRDPARKALVLAYERRVQTEFTHPVFRYKVTWRRAMEVQARMVLGVLDGTQSGYAGVRVR